MAMPVISPIPPGLGMMIPPTMVPNFPPVTPNENFVPIIKLHSGDSILCQMFGPLQGVAYCEQKILKQQKALIFLKRLEGIITNLFPSKAAWIASRCAKYNGVICPVAAIKGSPREVGYRTKCHFFVGYHPETLKPSVGLPLGNYEEGELHMQPVDCLYAIPAKMKQILRCFRTHVTRSGLEPYNPTSHVGVWRSIQVLMNSEGDSNVVVAANTHNVPNVEIETMKENLKSFFTNEDIKNIGIKNIYFQPWNPVLERYQQACPHLLVGNGEPLLEKLDGVTLHLSPNCNFEVNSVGTREMLTCIEEVIKCGTPLPKIVLDIHSSSGFLGLFASQFIKEVWCLEENPHVAKVTEENIEANKRPNCKLLGWRILDALEHFSSRRGMERCMAVFNFTNVDNDPIVIVYTLLAIRRCSSIKKLLLVIPDWDIFLEKYCEHLFSGANPRYKDTPPFGPKLALPIDMVPDTGFCYMVLLLERGEWIQDNDQLEYGRSPAVQNERQRLMHVKTERGLEKGRRGREHHSSDSSGAEETGQSTHSAFNLGRFWGQRLCSEAVGREDTLIGAVNNAVFEFEKGMHVAIATSVHFGEAYYGREIPQEERKVDSYLSSNGDVLLEHRRHTEDLILHTMSRMRHVFALEERLGPLPDRRVESPPRRVVSMEDNQRNVVVSHSKRDDQRSRDRSRHSSRGRSRHNSRERSRHNSRERSRHNSRERSRHSSRGRSRLSSRERSRHSSRGRGRSRLSSRGRSRHSSRERSRHYRKHSSKASYSGSDSDSSLDSSRGRHKKRSAIVQRVICNLDIGLDAYSAERSRSISPLMSRVPSLGFLEKLEQISPKGDDSRQVDLRDRLFRPPRRTSPHHGMDHRSSREKRSGHYDRSRSRDNSRDHHHQQRSPQRSQRFYDGHFDRSNSSNFNRGGRQY